MITQEHEYYLRFILLLIHGGTELLREIAAKALQKCNTPLNILLSMNASVIQKTSGLSKKQKDILYPSSTEVSDIRDFDITLLSYLLTKFLTANLDSIEKNAVDDIKEMRNFYLAHATEAKMTASTYFTEWNKLVGIIVNASQNLPEEKRTYLFEIIKYIENEQLGIEVVIDEIQKLDQTHDFFEYIKKSLDDLNQTIDARFREISKDLLELKMMMENYRKKIEFVYTVRGQVTLSEDDQETVHYAEKLLLEATKDHVEKSQTEHNKQLKEKVGNFVEDVENLDIKVEKISEGSIVFEFKCFTLSALRELIDYFNGSKLKARLHEIAAALEDITCKKIDVSGSLDIQSFQDVISKVRGGCVPESPLTELAINEKDEGDLPHPDVFKHVSRRKRCSDSFKDQCRSVCRYIQGTSKEIKTVWPAYKYSKHKAPKKYTNIVFIVITNNGEENLTAFNYNIYQRAEKMCSNNESAFINKLECDCEVSDQDHKQIEQIENCIAQHSDELIKSYQNLTMIIPSFFKSKKFGSQDAEIQPMLCLVLYTQIKGFIPLSEEPFPEEIDGFPVDVREDTFTFSHGPSDYHQSIKMGCEIGSDKLNEERNPLRGTLGGFVEDNVHGPCCFTCAHVIFPDLTQLADTLIWIEDGERISVFQPSLVTDKLGVAFGRVVKAVFDCVAGVDAALIKIENREPTSGEFPHSPSETIFSHEEPMIYSTGRICHRSNLKRNRVVYKFGASTNITQGVLQVHRGVVVSEIPEIREHEVGDKKFSLRDQIFIYKVDESAFSAPGDSGALVFVEEDDKTLIAIGMVEGTTFSQKSVATPIHKIIKALDLKTQELKRF